MTFSDANPIQFWPVSELTYNETEVCGINPACWCQPWNLADGPLIQFTDSSSPSDFLLGYFDEGGYLVTVTAFTEADGVHSATVGFPTLGLYALKIFSDTSLITFPIEADTWTQTIGHLFTSRTDTTFNFTATPGTFAQAIQPLVLPTGASIKFRTIVTITGTWNGNVSVTAIPSPNATAIEPVLASEYTFQVNQAATVIDWIFEVSGGSTANLNLTVNFSGGGTGTANVSVDISDQQTAGYVNPNEFQAKSDCQDVKTSHDCSELVTYGNASDYAGLQYSSLGTPLFNVRVPAVFFHEDSIEEREDHELSNDTIIEVQSKITRKKRFDIGFVPYYFHMKLRLVFAHQLVQIDDVPWIKRSGDAYETEGGNKRYPLKKASVMLTDKDYIKRNLL